MVKGHFDQGLKSLKLKNKLERKPVKINFKNAILKQNLSKKNKLLCMKGVKLKALKDSNFHPIHTYSLKFHR